MEIDSNRKLLNVPLILSSRVLVQNQAGEMVPDPNWHSSVKATLDSLYSYLVQQQLLTPDFVQRAIPVDSLVITAGDLTARGLSLWQSGAVNRWLASFDRSPGKSVTNYKILEAALCKIPEALPNNSFKPKPLRGSA